jgi:hypothetical protein
MNRFRQPMLIFHLFYLGGVLPTRKSRKLTWRYSRRHRCRDHHSAAEYTPCCWDTPRSARTLADSWAARPRSPPGTCTPRDHSPRGTARWARTGTARRGCEAARRVLSPDATMKSSPKCQLGSLFINRTTMMLLQGSNFI